MADDYGNSAQTATPLTIGASIGGNIDPAGDVDVFALSLTGGALYKFTLVGATSSSVFENGSTIAGLDPAMTLYNGAGTSLRTDDNSGGGLNAAIEFTPDATGTYYLYVGSLSRTNNAGSYTLGTQLLTPAGTPAPTTTPAADDYAGSAATTGRLSAGATAPGRIESVGDRDWFAITLTAGTTYQFTQTASSGSSIDSFLSLRNGGGAILAENDDFGTGLNSQITYTPTVSGTYYVDAHAYGSSTGAYTLGVSASTPAPTTAPSGGDDYAGSTATSGRVSVGGSVTGRIETGGDRDWFAISLSAGSSYQFALNAASGSSLDPYVSLRNAGGAILAEDDDSGPGLNSLLSYTPTASGTFYLDAHAYSTSTGGYTLSVTGPGATPAPTASTGSTPVTAITAGGTVQTPGAAATSLADSGLAYVFQSSRSGAGITPASYSYFYTTSATEAQSVLAHSDWPWVQLRSTFESAHSAPGSSVPVFRFWSDRFQAHFFTISTAERDQLIDWTRTGYNNSDWRLESSEAFRVYTNSNPVDAAGRHAIPVYRVFIADKDFNSANGMQSGHYFTADVNQYNQLVTIAGVSGEGVAFYGEYPGT